jgi:hypothetical protein
MAGALSFTTLAAAQSDAVRALYLSAANVPTNIASIHTYAEPPKGFNPLAASDAELATYGFPPRPDKQADPEHYSLWERAMAAARIRWHGELKPVSFGGHGTIPAGSSSAKLVTATTTTGPKQLSNITGSGVVLTNTLRTWSNTASFNDIWTEISVPVAQPPFGNSAYCPPPYYSASLAGIDGSIRLSDNGTPFFLPEENAGALSFVNCAGQASYDAYVGWGSTLNTVFPLNPGDVFYTELHAFGGCNNGSAFVEDLTTLTYNSYTIANPCFENQIGHTANWTVWRPCCGGYGPDGEWPLANTISIFFDGGAVLNGSGKRFYPGSQATTTQILTMTNDGGDQAIEIVNQGNNSGYEGQHGLFFQTTGCAFTGGCTP